MIRVPSARDDGAEDGDEDQDGGDLKGQQQRGEERVRDLGDVGDGAREIAAEVGSAEVVALGEEDEAEQAEDRGGTGKPAM